MTRLLLAPSRSRVGAHRIRCCGPAELGLIALIGVAACGRIGFDAAGDGVVAVGHDEDGDGVPDGRDVCPYLADDQADGDGDGVGDLCDPNPAVARDRIALFSTMGTGDMPFTVNPASQAPWTQLDDSLQFAGPLTTDVYGGLDLPYTAGDIRFAIGIEIVAVGDPAFQHQFSMRAADQPPLYFGELNEQVGTYSRAEITRFSGTSYSQQSAMTLASGIQPGVVSLLLTERVGTGVHLDAAWPGEPYTADVMDTLYQGTTKLQLNVNNLQIEIRYVCVITSS